MRAETVRARFLFREVAEKGHDLPLGSVTKDGGVEFRSDLNVSVWNPGDDVSGYKRVGKDDFVIGLRSFQSGIGYSAIEALVSPAYTVLRPVSKQIHPPFFRYLFKSSAYISRLENVAQGIRQGRTISSEDFYNIAVRVPPLSEQKAIADYLDRETARIDALIEKKQRQIKLIEERFNADGLNIISGVSRDFENSSDKSGSVNRSGEWLPLKLAWCLKTGSGTTPTSGTANYYSEDGIPWVTTAELREDVILKTSMGVTDEARRNFSALKIFPTGTVLVAMYGATVGRAAVLGIEACVNQACCAIFGQGRIKIDFFYWWARLHRQDLIDLGYGSGQPNISQDTIRSLRIDTPSVEQQEAIVHYLANSWARTEALLNMTKQHIQLLVERKQSMITAAVTGELEIPGVAA